MEQRTFVVRVVRDAAGRLAGQISDPIEGWRQPFAEPGELWRLLDENLVPGGNLATDGDPDKLGAT